MKVIVHTTNGGDKKNQSVFLFSFIAGSVNFYSPLPDPMPPIPVTDDGPNEFGGY